MAGEKLLNLGLCFALTTKRDLYSAILDMTRDFGFQGLILRTAPLVVCYNNPGVLNLLQYRIPTSYSSAAVIVYS